MSDPWQAICDVWSIEPEDHATRSRDYGRGFADAVKQVRAAIEANGISFEEDEPSRFTSNNISTFGSPSVTDGKDA